MLSVLNLLDLVMAIMLCLTSVQLRRMRLVSIAPAVPMSKEHQLVLLRPPQPGLVQITLERTVITLSALMVPAVISRKLALLAGLLVVVRLQRQIPHSV
jgi:hypothetical protein